jgi:drug/metabolite transporter (DMT)-like permease
MARADLLLLVANLVYGTSYVVTRLTLTDIPPATLALLRVVIGAVVLLPLARLRQSSRPPTARGRIALMGLIGFAGAFALANWGVAYSTATNAALLITVEPLTLVLAGPLVLGERLRRSELAGAVLALLGATLVVVNGIPGLTYDIFPRWRGDALLVLAGVAYAAYSIIGRPVLARGDALAVTAQSIRWGAVGLAPFAALEWLAGHRPAPSATAVAGALYLGIVITALGYLAWNWALERVTAARAGIFGNLQPVVGAGLAIGLLDERATLFTAAGGVLVVVGIFLTMRHAGD